MEIIVSIFFPRYYEISSELLTSVKRTEDSLLKLKSYRKSLTPSSAGGGGMSDDNKIRLQISLDIDQYSALVSPYQLLSEYIFSAYMYMGVGGRSLIIIK